MAGTVVADTFQSSITGTPPQFKDGVGTQIGTLCRAFVNFNGTGTVAIRASFNVSSITDNGTGDYTVNFTNAMPDANFAVTANGGAATTNTTVSIGTSPTTSVCRVFNVSAGVVSDNSVMNVAIFR